MSAGLRLAAAWVVRVIALPLLGYSALLVVGGFAIAWRFRDDRVPTYPAVFIVVGSVVFAAAWYAEWHAVAEIRRQAAARCEQVPQGFEVVRPTDPSPQS